MNLMNVINLEANRVGNLASKRLFFGEGHPCDM